MPKLSKTNKYLTMPMAILTAIAVVSTSLLAYGQFSPLLTGALSPAIPSIFGTSAKSRSNTSVGNTGTVGIVGLTCTISITNGEVIAKMKRGAGGAMLGGSPQITMYYRIIGTGPWLAMNAQSGQGNAAEFAHSAVRGREAEEYYAECRTAPTDFTFSTIVPFQSQPQFVSTTNPSSAATPTRSAASAPSTFNPAGITCELFELDGELVVSLATALPSQKFNAQQTVSFYKRNADGTLAGPLIKTGTDTNASVFVARTKPTISGTYFAICKVGTSQAISNDETFTVSTPPTNGPAGPSSNGTPGAGGSASVAPQCPKLLWCYLLVRSLGDPNALKCELGQVAVPAGLFTCEDMGLYPATQPAACREFIAGPMCKVNLTVNGQLKYATP